MGVFKRSECRRAMAHRRLGGERWHARWSVSQSLRPGCGKVLSSEYRVGLVLGCEYLKSSHKSVLKGLGFSRAARERQKCGLPSLRDR